MLDGVTGNNNALYAKGSTAYALINAEQTGAGDVVSLSRTTYGCVLRLTSTDSLYDGTEWPALEVGVKPSSTWRTQPATASGWSTTDKCVAIFYGHTRAHNHANFSDARLKEDIEPLGTSLEALLQLRGVSFKWKSSGAKGVRNFGFIAQEVEKVFPDLVQDDAQGYKSLSYPSLIPVLVEAVRELDDRHRKEINELQSRLDRLEQLLAASRPADAKE